MFGIEEVIENIALKLGKDPLEVRRINLYRDPKESGDAGSMTTQYGQEIIDWVGEKLINQLAVDSNYEKRRADIRTFNADTQRKDRFKKRGIALVPLKFGISFTATMLNQAGALVNIYMDGSVSVNHGGTEMGQGLNTKMAQVAADALSTSVAHIRVTGTDTQKVPNASATAASSGADLNGAAIMAACAKLRAKLDTVDAGRKLPWPQLCKEAWLQRVGLSETGFYLTPDIKYDFATLQGKAFYYFCYGAAVSEVEIDTRTGEWWLKAVDILHDVGKSINPAIDKGQIEGAYVQGMGWLTMEECIWDLKGKKTADGHSGRGKFLTHGPSTYKIPVASDVPEHFNVALFDCENVKPTPYRSKAVGEPPLMLALSAFFALKDATASVAGYQKVSTLTAPATPERILMSCEALR
jgi:xanthine dehydrogenase large subunit